MLAVKVLEGSRGCMSLEGMIDRFVVPCEARP